MKVVLLLLVELLLREIVAQGAWRGRSSGLKFEFLIEGGHAGGACGGYLACAASRSVLGTVSDRKLDTRSSCRRCVATNSPTYPEMRLVVVLGKACAGRWRLEKEWAGYEAKVGEGSREAAKSRGQDKGQEDGYRRSMDSKRRRLCGDGAPVRMT